MHAAEWPLFAYHSQTKRGDKEELNTCQNELKMTATQDTDLTSLSLGQAEKGLLRIQAPREGVPGLWAQGGPPSVPFLRPVEAHHSCLCSQWNRFGASVCPLTPNFSITAHCSLIRLKSCLSDSSCNCYCRVRRPRAAQAPSLVNLSDLWRPAFLYSFAPKFMYG